jgi:hypothetical protein
MSARRTPRIAIPLTPGERDALRQLAAAGCEPEARVAGRLLRAALADHGAALDAAPRHRVGTRSAAPVEHGDAAWLPPSIRADGMVALRERYPAELRHLPADLSADPLVGEQLAALTVWRERLDDGQHDDPRMELAFAHELRDFGAWLQTRARRNR